MNQSRLRVSIRFFRPALFLAFALSAAQAQIGIYGKFDATNLSGTSNNFETLGWYKGGGGGLYYDFIHLGPVRLGADLRGNFLTGNQQKFKSVLGGLRLSVKPPILPIRPYIQGLVGVGGASHSGLGNTGTIYSNKFEYQVVGGLDYTLFPHIDWRAAEIGYGRISGISSNPSAPAVNTFTLGTGIVVRFP
jgi:hypothetical protein